MNNRQFMSTKMEPVLQMNSICKVFGKSNALIDVSIDLFCGEVLGLMGENGAGKTTLMKILFGLYQLTSGEIIIEGQQQPSHRTPDMAISSGLGMVHQHFMLVKSFTVCENLALGLNTGTSPWINLEQIQKKVIELSESYNLSVAPDKLISDMTVGEQQRVEILNALIRNTRVLILDEPTAVLTPQETEGLFKSIELLTSQGKSVIFITHKLEEAMTISDRIVVLRQGKKIGVRNRIETNHSELANMMIGREVAINYDRRPYENKTPFMDLANLWAKDDRGLDALKGINLQLCKGEILGLCGVDHNGQLELCEVISGMRKSTQGEILINGEQKTNLNCRDAIKEKIAYIPDDRQTTAIIMNHSAWRNVILKRFEEDKFYKFGLFFMDEIRNFAQKLFREYDISLRDEEIPIKYLSGGNQQKLVVARELSDNPEIIIANQPTRGLDISAIEFVHSKLMAARESGKAILLVSRELSEIFSLSDRIAVIYEGRIMAVLPRDEATIEQIGLWMAGQYE